MRHLSKGALGFFALALVTGCASPNPVFPGLHGSVGLPHHGVLTDGEKLARRGPGFERFRGDDVAWGTPRLVKTIALAAQSVSAARAETPALVVGDLSERRGGKAERHRSHRTGRDVDILFYAMTSKGVPIRAAGFVKYQGDGLGEAKRGKMQRFDVERNWLLVKALLQNEAAPVQWLFVSRPLEVLLIEHAIAKEEDLELVWRAESVLRQPGDSAPHDDHFHMRLACTTDELVAGCTGGPRWPWDEEVEVVAVSDEELVAALLEDL